MSASIGNIVQNAENCWLPEPKPDELADEDGCYIDDLKPVLPYDEPYYPEDACETYICQRNNETLHESCGAVYVNPGCTKSAVDLTKDYPACCGTEVCPSTTQSPTTQAPTSNQGSYAYTSAQSVSGQAPETAQALPLFPTTQALTTQAPASD